LKTLGNQTVTATDTVTASITRTSGPISVGTNAATHLSLARTVGFAVAGTAFNVTVTALDAANNVATGYAGTVHFTSTDVLAVLPPNSTLANGVGTFPVTLNTIGRQSVTATDTVTASITGALMIGVFSSSCQGQGKPCTDDIRIFPPCCHGLMCVAEGDREYCEPDPDADDFKIPSRFTATCTMDTARESHTATLLGLGIMLIAGGDNGSASLATAELFNSETHTFAPVGDMVNGRARHTATLLPNGAVLVTGGRDAQGNAQASAEIFNPANMSFAPTNSMSGARESHTATLLRGGKVLVAGGEDGNVALATAEVFDPATGTFAPTGSLDVARSFQTATLLKNGKVLVAGGRDAHGNVLASTELFDPVTGRFSPAQSMQSAREFHTATLLNDGRVLIAGGDDGSATLATAELFDPATGKFTAAGSMESARELYTATLRADGTVLVAGGVDFTSQAKERARAGQLLDSMATAELFDPASNKFSPTSAMTNARARHTATLLPEGEVVVIGGTLSGIPAQADFLASAELFQ